MALLGRDTLVTGPFDKGLLLLETFRGQEALGVPYRYAVTLLSSDPNIPAEKLFGQPLTIHLKLETGGTRYFNGVVTYFAKAGLSMRHTRYAAVLEPRLSLFDHARDCRVINEEGQTALSIVTDCLAQRGFTDVDAGGLQDHVYLERDYCLQYRETDRNFVQRLLEEEGIYYFFKHEDGKHRMVLADSAAAHAKAPGYESVMYLPKERRQSADEEHFSALRVARAMYPGDYTVVRGYDYTKPRPRQAQFGKRASDDTQPGRDFESYDYPGGLSIESEAEAEALIRYQGDVAAGTVVEVEGNTVGIGVGDLVRLRRPIFAIDEYNPFWNEEDFENEYLVTSADYAFSINQYETGEATGPDEPFKARYTLLDSHTPFRRARTAVKPRIEGPQTALVVGPAGEEIYTDKYGRVKVQFDWDRLGDRDEQSSCWIRVAQVWAGKQWGAVHIPRIGQEVIVEFLDGDPDRPIITGSVYNADNMPPYDLPEGKTRSGIKSRSSKGGSASNFNEIRFEDRRGKEELHIQAERDVSTRVKRNQRLSVEGDRDVNITGNQSTTISGHGSSHIQCATKVTGKYDLDVSDTIHVKAPTSIIFECGGSKIEMLPDKITITSGGNATIVLDGNVLVQSSAGAKTVHDSNVLHQSVPGAKVLLDANVLAQSLPGAKVVLDEAVLAESVAGSKVVLDEAAAMQGTTNALVQGAVEASLTGAAGAVKAGAGSAEVSGPKVDITGQAMVSIAGGTVKIN